MKEEREKTMKVIIEKIKRFPFTKSIIIFGSYGINKPTPLSDIDICVIDDPAYPLKERKKIYGLSTDLFDVNLFSELPLPVQYEVFKGKVVFNKNKKYFLNLKNKTFFEYLDTQYIWKEYYKNRVRRRKWALTF